MFTLTQYVAEVVIQVVAGAVLASLGYFVTLVRSNSRNNHTAPARRRTHHRRSRHRRS